MSSQDYFSKIICYTDNIHIINNIFCNWGYKSVLVPLIDNEKHYSQHSKLDQDIFKALNFQNELMLLRTDSTLFLSKILGSHIQKKMLPLRLFYSNSVLYSIVEYDAKHWQSGVELIGVDSPTAEFEVISLLYSLVHSLIDDFCIHISSRTLLIELFKQSSKHISKNEYERIFSLIVSRKTSELEKIFNEKIIASIFNIADAKEYNKWKKNISSIIGNSNENLNYFTTFFEALLDIDKKYRIRADLSELGNHSYYSDTVFTVFSPTLPSPLARGGRYDNLLKKYGYHTPAIGFSLYPHLIANYLIDKNKNPSPLIDNPFYNLYGKKNPSNKELLSCFHKLNNT